MLPLLFFEEAGEEIEHERSYYRERSTTAEAAFLRELDHAVDVVSEAPLRWPGQLTRRGLKDVAASRKSAMMRWSIGQRSG